MPNYITTHLMSQAGIQRDSTVYDSESYVDGVWTRFYKGKPRKMGGYRALRLGNAEVVRNMFGRSLDQKVQVYMGQPTQVGYMTVLFNGTASIRIDRTPASQFVPDPNNQWSFDVFTGSLAGVPISSIIAQAAPNALDPSCQQEGQIFFGNTDDNLALEPVEDPSLPPGNTYITCSGGVVFVPPILVALDKNGRILFSNPNKVSGADSWSTEGVLNTAAVGNSNLVRGFRTRGGVNPTILIWSTNSLISATYDPTTASFSSQELEDGITVMSPNSIIKYNQQFFWVGTDQFYMFNGIVQKLPNTFNTDFFFDNINPDYRAKTFGWVNPRQSELIWHFVRKLPGVPDDQQPTEPNHAVIFNLSENKWYDTPYSRTAALSSSTSFPFPILADSNPYVLPSGTFYPIWQHEVGVNKVIDGVSSPIPASFQTSYIDLFTQSAPNDVTMFVKRFAPDFIMEGSATVSVLTRRFPQSPDRVLGPFTFNEATEHVDDVVIEGRLVSFKFEMNCLDGYFQMGSPLLSYNEGAPQP